MARSVANWAAVSLSRASAFSMALSKAVEQRRARSATSPISVVTAAVDVREGIG
jgi:hypothetical protein